MSATGGRWIKLGFVFLSATTVAKRDCAVLGSFAMCGVWLAGGADVYGSAQQIARGLTRGEF